MSKMSKVLLSAVGIWLLMAYLHATLNLGFHPSSLLGFGKKGVAEETRFRVGFLPVT
jgi:hypothetical protein